MTSFAFILGVVPLVLATGAGAAARISLGLAVFTGMIASTCLAVLFVPSFFVSFGNVSKKATARAAELPLKASRSAPDWIVRPLCLQKREQ